MSIEARAYLNHHVSQEEDTIQLTKMLYASQKCIVQDTAWQVPTLRTGNEEGPMEPIFYSSFIFPLRALWAGLPGASYRQHLLHEGCSGGLECCDMGIVETSHLPRGQTSDLTTPWLSMSGLQQYAMM